MTLPPRSGLYDPRFEHDACGFGFVANIDGKPSHSVVLKGIQLLVNLEHRGACGCDPLTGDGAGLLMQIPHAFFEQKCGALGFALPAVGDYGVGFLFLPNDAARRETAKQIVENKILESGQKLLGWREVPTVASACGPLARETLPSMAQVFIGRGNADAASFERKLYVIGRWAARTVREQLGTTSGFNVTSLSSRTIIYKGLLLPDQLSKFYPDFSEELMSSAIAMVHQRFSTNTFPAWELAQPFHALCHNGEINTLRGNLAWMKAREQMFGTEVFGDDVERIRPVINPKASDSASLDNAVELLMHAGRSLPHVMMMMVPEAWQNDALMPQVKKDFYEYHSCLMEPWDGPAALAFSDGKVIGAILDRNGLRPARWQLSKDGTVIVASESGVIEYDPSDVVRRGRLEPGKMFLVDLERKVIVEDEALKLELASRKPYGKWIKENKISLKDLPEQEVTLPTESLALTQLQKIFGYTLEDLRILIAPMATSGAEAVGSMGTDTPLAVLSDEPQLVYSYFKQHFAQVTNPPIDPIREELVMSLKTNLGAEGNLLTELPDQAQMLELPHPILTNDQLAQLRVANIRHQRKPPTLSMLYRVADGEAGMKAALTELCRQATVAIQNEHGFVVLSDRGTSSELSAVPALLATAAVHHHLVRAGTRMKLGLIVETADAREVHHFCLLTGYGAGAINPYLALDSIAELVETEGLPGVTDVKTAQERFVSAIYMGLKKVMSKMGISTLQSYRGAQIFECIGLSPSLVDQYFSGTASRVSGIGLDVIAQETAIRHERAFPRVKTPLRLDVGGSYHYRAQGERHLWSPRVVGALQRAVRMEDVKSYDEYAALINDQATTGLITLRGMWDFNYDLPEVPLSEVEPATEIVKRFATGAMSFGSISGEAHENLAIAMNQIGGRSNTGEGGEKPERFEDNRRSAIKQVASARFGVTTHYLVNADELQIKIAQGAKPGEGGQLPGHKVDELIAKTRNSTPGVTLISPPPHHDIYSIEDLAQLIFDLKMVNPKARISVKLVSEAGVGTVAAGVAKAHADLILISGHDGGTGASPQTSIKHAGGAWELGLAEAHQVLVKNGLRDRVTVQTDGQLRTGRDVAFAALLGAEEFGFATAPLVASGCILMRKCHLNTCPVGIATQDPELRKKFTGKPEHVIRFMFYVAEETRKYMAKLGYRNMNEMVGHPERLKKRETTHWKASRLDFTDVFKVADRKPGFEIRKMVEQDHGVERTLDARLIETCRPAIDQKQPQRLVQVIRNTDRSVGAQLGGAIAMKNGAAGLPEGTLKIKFEGTAGQSFGAFLTSGVEFDLHGDANDYVGKGLSGGIVSVRPAPGTPYVAKDNVISGNVCLYGATSGKAFFNGMVGERFAVRNSGATTVVEGVGDHGCEYMTGGMVVILGDTGRNFAAGMSGGFAFVYDANGRFGSHCNIGMVELVKPDAGDLLAVKALVEEHVSRTDSPLAKTLLASWASTASHLVKVFPKEYRRVLEERARRSSTAPSAIPPAP